MPRGDDNSRVCVCACVCVCVCVCKRQGGGTERPGHVQEPGAAHLVEHGHEYEGLRAR
jgi:hypothetical protein